MLFRSRTACTNLPLMVSLSSSSDSLSLLLLLLLLYFIDAAFLWNRFTRHFRFEPRCDGVKTKHLRFEIGISKPVQSSKITGRGCCGLCGDLIAPPSTRGPGVDTHGARSQRAAWFPGFMLRPFANKTPASNNQKRLKNQYGKAKNGAKPTPQSNF